MNETTMDFSRLDRSSRRRISAVPMAFRRAPAAAINWEDRLICLKGPRGCGKTFDQIADDSKGFLAVDDTEIGSRHRIPLWMFGLLY